MKKTIFFSALMLLSQFALGQSAAFEIEPASTRIFASFRNLSTGADSVLWRFGDGDSSSETHVVHQYADTPTETAYPVELIAYFGAVPDTARDTFVVSARPNATEARYRVLNRPDPDGTRKLYVDATYMDPISTAIWYGSAFPDAQLPDDSLHAIVTLSENGQYEANVNFNSGARFGFAIVVTQVAPRDRARPRHSIDIDSLSITIRDKTVPGVLGIDSIQAIFSQEAGKVDSLTVPASGSATWTAPTAGVYRIVYQVRSDPHPISGESEVYESGTLVSLVGDPGQIDTTSIVLQNQNEYDLRSFDLDTIFSTGIQTQANLAGSAYNLTSFTPSLPGAYQSEIPSVRGGNLVDFRDSVPAVAAIVGDHLVRVSALPGNPFLGQTYGSNMNPDYVRGPGRAQLYAGRSNVQVPEVGGGTVNSESALDTDEEALVILAQFFAQGYGFSRDWDNVPTTYLSGATNTVEGVQTQPVSMYATPLQIMLGFQIKSTTDLGNEGSPVISVDNGGGNLMLQAKGLGVGPGADTTGLPRDFAVSDTTDTRTLFEFPAKTLEDSTGYLVIVAFVKNGATGRGPLKAWVIPVGEQGTRPSLDVGPLLNYDDARLWEAQAAAPHQVPVWTDHFYSTRLDDAFRIPLNNMLGHFSQDSGYTTYTHPYPYYVQVRDTAGDLALPSNATILHEAYTHLGIDYYVPVDTTVAPDRPTGLIVAHSDVSSTIAWDEMPNATSYRVRLRDLVTLAYIVDTTVSRGVTTRSASGLVPDQAHRWFVLASNPAGSSSYATADFTTDTLDTRPPSTPVISSITAGDTTASVSFSAVRADSFFVRLSDTLLVGIDSLWTTSTTASFSGIPDDSIMRIAITAQNAYGDSSVSDTFSTNALPILIQPDTASWHVILFKDMQYFGRYELGDGPYRTIQLDWRMSGDIPEPGNPVNLENESGTLRKRIQILTPNAYE